jgi:hypothetical protein
MENQTPCKKPGRVKGREWLFACLWGLACVGSKTMVDHFRLKWVQAYEDKKSGASRDNFFNRKAPDSPSPLKNRQDP